MHLLFPALPVHTPWLYAVLAELTAVSIGLAAGVVPAMRAAQLDPVLKEMQYRSLPKEEW